MLVSLHVKNFAIIDEIEVDFLDHLNILSGETGAGKSIIIGSINIALGGKVSSDFIRKGADYALVELVFYSNQNKVVRKMEELDIPIEDGQIILSRKIMKSRSINKINGETVTAGNLKELAALLIDIHGQHSHQSLLYKQKHLEILDQFAQEEIKEVIEKYRENFHLYQKLKKEIEEKTLPEEERLREQSFLEYEKKEIESARLKEGEEEELSIQYKKLSNTSQIIQGLSEVYSFTGDGNQSISEQIGRALRQLTKLEEYDQEIKEYSQQLFQVEDILNIFNRDLVGYMSELDYNKEELDQVEERLNLIHSLKSKYGNTIENVLERYNEIVKKLEQYQDYETYMKELSNRYKEVENTLMKLAEKLSSLRKQKAIELGKKIQEALVDLNFLQVKFEPVVIRGEKFTEQGVDEVEFQISTNPGEDLKPLHKIASGGELSRIMLALKSVLAEQDAIETLIFDEIDVGVSGRTAQKVSEKMSYIAHEHQVICITHLPQIAAMSDHHYVIEKIAENGVTKTNIRKLEEKESVEELARILGGAKITQAVLESAKEMKQLAENTKVFKKK